MNNFSFSISVFYTFDWNRGFGLNPFNSTALLFFASVMCERCRWQGVGECSQRVWLSSSRGRLVTCDKSTNANSSMHDKLTDAYRAHLLVSLCRNKSLTPYSYYWSATFVPKCVLTIYFMFYYCGIAGPFAARGDGYICHPFHLRFWKLESCLKRKSH